MEYYGFFNGGTEYGQEEFNRYFDNIYESGIAVNSDGSMQYPIAISSGKVTVGKGFAILKGFYHYNDSPKEFQLSPDVNYSKKYRVILQLNVAQSSVRLLVRAGGASSAPSTPALTRTDSIYELSLGQYRVTKNGGITLVRDERSNNLVCGAIRPKTLTAYNAAMKENQRLFDEWFKQQQGTGWRNIYTQSTTPSGAVSGSIWINELT